MALYEEYFGRLLSPYVDVARVSAPTRGDTLIVVDMQNDFLPSGAFGVPEGDAVVEPIADLIQRFANAGARVFATRDYHPGNHCSFTTHGGPFPPHCIQNSKGSHICPEVAEALRKAKGAARVFFKGFSPDVDSFGALPYEEAECGSRVSSTRSGFCGSAWTGAFALHSSTADDDINAPPDVMSVLTRVSLAELIDASHRPDRVFVVGLAFDYCVIDTACNAARLGHHTIIVPSATRAAHLSAVGSYGSGFLSDPADIARKLTDAGVRLAEILPSSSS